MPSCQFVKGYLRTSHAADVIKSILKQNAFKSSPDKLQPSREGTQAAVQLQHQTSFLDPKEEQRVAHGIQILFSGSVPVLMMKSCMTLYIL